MSCSTPSGEARPDGAGAHERGARPHGTPSYRARLDPEPFPFVSQANPNWDRQRVWSRFVDWEPVVATDPATPDVYQLTTRYFAPECPTCPDPTIVFRRSADGGASWSEDGYLSRRGQELVDPQMVVAADGTLFAAYLEDWWPGPVVVRSHDRGQSWSRPVAPLKKSDLEWGDKPILAISADGQDVYLAFNSDASYVAASHDAGRSFAAPVETDGGNRIWFHTDGAVAADGTVYFAATDYSTNLRGRAHISVLRSTDGGDSWQTQRIDTSEEAPPCRWWAAGCYTGFLGPSAAIAIDSSGVLMLVYNAGTDAGRPQTLWLRTSADGVVWSSRRRLSKGHSAINNAFPAVEAGPLAGDFRVVWQDDRKTGRPKLTNPTRWWNTWYRRTTDGGASWSRAIRLSRGGTTTTYSSGRGYSFPYGDYLWLAVDGEDTNYVTWGAGESYDGNGGTWYTTGR